MVLAKLMPFFQQIWQFMRDLHEMQLWHISIPTALMKFTWRDLLVYRNSYQICFIFYHINLSVKYINRKSFIDRTQILPYLRNFLNLIQIIPIKKCFEPQSPPLWRGRYHWIKSVVVLTRFYGMTFSDGPQTTGSSSRKGSFTKRPDQSMSIKIYLINLQNLNSFFHTEPFKTYLELENMRLRIWIDH